jgi:benzoyl-CoA-dihydrodiol lyase
MGPAPASVNAIRFDTSPDRYRHWTLRLSSPAARLSLKTSEEAGLRPDYQLKLNSYDLAVDIELADAVRRIRFEHPEVRALVIESGLERVFCAGANIQMLGSSDHAFKVNFCKFTNETRLYLEELSEESGTGTIAALAGTASGGGYELALACDYILLQDDASTAVSLPEVPLLGVLPGTGGLTRLVDKRCVRPDLADLFSTTTEGVRGSRARDWGLVDGLAPRSRFASALQEIEGQIAASRETRTGPGVQLPNIEPQRSGRCSEYEYVTLDLDPDRRMATITLRGPASPQPTSLDARRKLGAELWALRAFLELDDTLLDLRFNHPKLGLLLIRTQGDPLRVLESDRALAASQAEDWFAREVVLLTRRVLKRLQQTARSIFAAIEPGSCFVGCLLELALVADRSFMLDCEEGPTIAFSPLNFGDLAMANGLSRLATRFLRAPEQVKQLEQLTGPLTADEALERGLVTVAPDDIDYENELRVALEERASYSPDALTGMEASLRFGGPETLETKIFGRLSAWQNWIFQRANAVGPDGALTTYGTPRRPEFDFTRT